MSTPLPSSSIQEAYISLGLNNQLLANLLMGVYTVVYLSTLYIYVSKKSSKNWLVVVSITLSYLVYVVSVSVTWFLLKIAFVDNGSSRETIFIASSGGPTWAVFVNNICEFLIAGVADGLMMWRCFNVWDRSFRAISLPLFLLFCEIGLDLSVIIIVPATHFNPSPSQARILDILLSTTLFVTFATTMITTVLIAYRIHSVAKQDVPQGSRSRFNHVLEILVQSAAAYSLATFAYAILLAIPFGSINTLEFNATQAYLGPFYFFISGIAPTIMVARVALASDANRDIYATTRVSGLQFQSTSPTVTQMGRESIHPVNGDFQLVHDPRDLEEKQGSALHIA